MWTGCGGGGGSACGCGRCCGWCWWCCTSRRGSIVIRIVVQTRLVGIGMRCQVCRWWWRWCTCLIGHVRCGCIRWLRWSNLLLLLWCIWRRRCHGWIIEVGGIVACLELLFLQDFALGRTADLARALAPEQLSHFGVFCRGLGGKGEISCRHKPFPWFTY